MPITLGVINKALEPELSFRTREAKMWGSGYKKSFGTNWSPTRDHSAEARGFLTVAL
jgi:hypothetical protein